MGYFFGPFENREKRKNTNLHRGSRVQTNWLHCVNTPLHLAKLSHSNRSTWLTGQMPTPPFPLPTSLPLPHHSSPCSHWLWKTQKGIHRGGPWQKECSLLILLIGHMETCFCVQRECLKTATLRACVSGWMVQADSKHMAVYTGRRVPQTRPLTWHTTTGILQIWSRVPNATLFPI